MWFEHDRSRVARRVGFTNNQMLFASALRFWVLLPALVGLAIVSRRFTGLVSLRPSALSSGRRP